MLQEKLLSLGDLTMQAAFRVNPHVVETERLAEELSRDLGIWLPNGREMSTMAAYLYPDASAERLVTMNLLMTFLWYVDDLYASIRAEVDEAPDVTQAEVYRNFIYILRTGTLPAQEHILNQTGLRLRAMMLRFAPAAWLERFACSLMEHLVSTTLPVSAILTDGAADLDKYLPLRALDSGMYPTIDLMELARGIYVPDEILAHPVLHQLREHTTYFAALMNDLFSYHKEVVVLGQRFNLIKVLMEARRQSFAEAVNEAILMINGYAAAFERDALNIPDFGDPHLNAQVASYVDGLRDQLAASYGWQISTNRYRSLESPFPELRTLL